MTKSFACSVLIVIAAALIESTILANLYILPVVPDLILISCIYLSLLNGRTYGQLNGFVSGLTLDFITGVPLGFNCILRTVISYIYGFFSTHIVITGIIVPVLTVSIGTLLKYVLVWLISLFYTAINPASILSFDFLFELIANTVLAPFVFNFLSFFSGTLSIHKDEDIEKYV